ncbi:MAG: hypothetical protein JWQ94_161 [Tardiphaga sp.]|nr:hypothetical protein [Tardiphaga sp.]
MINLKILSAAALMAVALPLIGSTESFAQGRGGHGGGGFHGGGGGFHGGGGFRGGGFRGGFGGGGFHRGGGWGRGGGLVAGALIGGALASGAYGYGGYGGYGDSYAYYGGGPYAGNGYYGGTPYDDGDDVVEVAPAGGDVNYCIQTYKSYNVRTGTYLGYDGLRHSCP